jgi:hypothetical protein
VKTANKDTKRPKKGWKKILKSSPESGVVSKKNIT